MKNKLLKTTFVISLAAPLAAIVSSCTTSKNVTVEKTTPEEIIPQSNGIEKKTVTFKAKDGQTGVTFEGATTVKAREGTIFGAIAHPIAYKDKRPQTYWVDKDGKEVTNNTKITDNMTVYPYFDADISLANCLSVIALEHTKFNITHYGSNAVSKKDGGTKPELLYSTDGFVWKDLDGGEGNTIDIQPGSAIYIRGDNPKGISHSEYNYSSFTMAGTVHLNGNVMSMIDNGTATIKAIPEECDYCFAKLFENCSGIKVISSDFLPATTLQPHCYDSMFKNCASLEAFPSYMLKATTLADSCYANMFTNCKSLTAIPTGLLKYATTLAEKCYFQMFRGCSGITELPNETLPATALQPRCYEGMFRECTGLKTLGNELLPATTLKEECYYGMFESCSALGTDTGKSTKDLKLEASTLAKGCYRAMFGNCTGMTEAPTLGATALAEQCYSAMFYNCTSLNPTTQISLPASTMAKQCYEYMFYNCEGLVTAPTLASTNLAERCYEAMFSGCISMTTGPNLPATILQPYCYADMFYKCTSMSTSPTISATTLANYCCYRMFAKSGIAASPALPATKAVEGCYKNMFDGCQSLTAVGYVSLGQLANNACYMMFVRCSDLTVLTGTGTGRTPFFKCPSTYSYTDSVTCMFQETEGVTYGFTPVYNQTYCY